jgi:hypothetical protein
MQQISEQFRVVEMDFRSREKLNKELKADLQKDLREILEIGYGLEGLQEEFDGDGDDDLLKLNFGGRNVDIKRSVLTKPRFGWNLFSCLFQKRWDGFHVRDRKGRIYVDLKEEWLRPLLDYMKYSDSSDRCLSGSNRSLVHIMGIFGMSTSGIFCLSPYDSEVVLNGLVEVSRIKEMQRRGGALYRKIAKEVWRSQKCALCFDFNLIYSLASEDASIPPIPENLDLRFKSFLVLLEMKDGYSCAYTVCTNQVMSSQANTEERCVLGKICTVADFFPLKFEIHYGHVLEIQLKLGNQNAYKRCEIYVFRPNYEIIQRTEESLAKTSEAVQQQVSNSKNEVNETNQISLNPISTPGHHLDILYNYMRDYDNALRRETDSIGIDTCHLDEEIQFMSYYFHISWYKDEPEKTSTPLELLKGVVRLTNKRGDSPSTQNR